MADYFKREGRFGLVVGHSIPANLQGVPATIHEVTTPFGVVEVHEVFDREEQELPPVFVLYRHGVALHTLASDINHKANMWAMKALGCTVLLLTSSVGACHEQIPFNKPLVITDLLMLENRLPGGENCTYGEGYLIAPNNLFSPDLRRQFQSEWAARFDSIGGACREVTYQFQLGPRVKTALEARALATLGVDTNSMTMGPEIVLANELGIATFAVGICHVGKSDEETGVFDASAGEDLGEIQRSLDEVDFSTIVQCYLQGCDPATRPATFMHIRASKL